MHCHKSACSNEGRYLEPDGAIYCGIHASREAKRMSDLPEDERSFDIDRLESLVKRLDAAGLLFS